MKKELVKKGLLYFIFVLLSAPFIQNFANIFKPLPLSGVYVTAQDATFSIPGWIEGKYQEDRAKYLNDFIGFRPDLVRLNNQLDYSVFDVLHSNLIRGKENYFFYPEYIDAWYGDDLVGGDSILQTTMQIKYLQDLFKKQGRTFLLTIAASKPEVYPEFLPDEARTRKPVTNRGLYHRYCDSLGVSYIDFSSWFSELRKKVPGSLMAKQGIHWSQYGATFVIDSIHKYFERDQGIDILNVTWPTWTTSYEGKFADDDIVRNLNLIYCPVREEFRYPTYQLENDTSKKKPMMICIGDSFVWALTANGFDQPFGRYEFWHYLYDVYLRGEAMKKLEFHQWQQSLDSADFVVIVYTTMNLRQISTFVDVAYRYYKGKETAATASVH